MPANRPYVVALGGVGGDAHSVGLTILRHALTSAGYVVRYLGAQCPLREFFQQEFLCNAILVSSVDGHARYYLQSFPELRQRNLPPAARAIWYLGGNLGARDEKAYIRHYKEMGFDRVFPSYLALETMLTTLAGDLTSIEPAAATQQPDELRDHDFRQAPEACEGKVPEPDLMRTRAEVLQQWRTGAAAADLDANALFLTKQPLFNDTQVAREKAPGSILIQPRCGVSVPRQQRDLFIGLKRHGIRVLSFQIDSLTRNNNYAAIDQILEAAATDSELSEASSSQLNGYPMVNHGVPVLRRITATTGIPLQTRHSTRDPRLLAEISFAGGVSSFEGGAVSYNVPYFRDYPLAQSIVAWQYVDRLVGLMYERYQIILDREFFGTLTGTLIPPSLAIVINLLEAAMAAQQGVRAVSLGYAEQGNRTQDIAACRTLHEMAHEFLRGLGFAHIIVNTVFHQYMAAFPHDLDRAASLIRASAVTAALSGVTRLLTKTPAEAFHIPGLADNLESIKLVREGLAAARLIEPAEKRIDEECRVIRGEAEAILDSVLYAGRGSILAGIPAAFEKGILDIPFAPSIHNAGQVLTLRDADGAVRYRSFGNLPFSREIRQFNEHRVSMRKRGMKTADLKDYALVEQDVLQIPRGDYEQWPLDYRNWNDEHR